MKIKRFTAANMQAGLTIISETLGPEAVILSNRRLSDGLEIVAGVDETEFELYQATLPEEVETSDIIKANPPAEESLDKETMQQLFAAMSDKNQKAFADQEQVQPSPQAKAEPVTEAAYMRPEPKFEKEAQIRKNTLSAPIQPEPDTPKDDSAISMLRQEIDGLKDLLREQTEQLKEPVTPPAMSPQYERLESRLFTLGFTGSLTRKLIAQYDRDDSIDQNWRKIMGRLASALPAPLYEPLSNGGIFALTGPTGAGKTTTIAKLAAHAVKDYGSDSVAVISLDWFQVGGQEILRSVTDILGVKFHAMSEKESLTAVLKTLKNKRMVLIDTSGSSEALNYWNKLMNAESLRNKIQTVLVLPAVMHPSAVSQFIQQHTSAGFTAVILSKLDEAACFGGVLEPVLKHRWPIWYCTTGQNIPQDIEIGDPKKLTRRLVKGLQPERVALATAS